MMMMMMMAMVTMLTTIDLKHTSFVKYWTEMALWKRQVQHVSHTKLIIGPGGSLNLYVCVCENAFHSVGISVLKPSALQFIFFSVPVFFPFFLNQQPGSRNYHLKTISRTSVLYTISLYILTILFHTTNVQRFHIIRIASQYLSHLFWSADNFWSIQSELAVPKKLKILNWTWTKSEDGKNWIGATCSVAWFSADEIWNVLTNEVILLLTYT